METLRYCFEIEHYGVADGEPVQLDSTFEDFKFSLTLKSLEMFEGEMGEPLIKYFYGDKAEDQTSGNFTRALASVCYMDLSDGTVKQNESTVEAFKNTEAYKICAEDAFFALALRTHAIKCFEERNKRSRERNDLNGKKPKK